MIGSLFNSIIKKYLSFKFDRLENNAFKVEQLQINQLLNFLAEAQHTQYGKKYKFSRIRNRADFIKSLPLVKYEDLFVYIEKMMHGEPDVLWPGLIKYFSKSSGTTNQRSKFIPISSSFIHKNLIRSGWDTTAFIYNIDPGAKIFQHKSIIMGGTIHPFAENKDILIGDVSAIMISTIPAIGRPFYTPDFETALMNNWDEKIEVICRKCVNERVVMFGGVPTWNIVLFNKMLEITGKNNMLEIWPDLKYYLHGGVSFEPYREMFHKYLPSDDFYYIEAYNASEGYFAVQDRPNLSGMRLLIDNGIYYEFIKPEHLHHVNAHLMTIDLSEVEIDENYVMVITNNSGLWRYVIGDTVAFTSIHPHRIKVTGRVEQYINAFGEELMISNADKALALTNSEFGVSVKEYTVAPYFIGTSNKGYHEWLIEFDEPPHNREDYQKKLDDNLRAINSDYDAKRFKDLALECLKVNFATPGIFHQWLRIKNKMGGQYKIPRLNNNRNYLNEILNLQLSFQNSKNE